MTSIAANLGFVPRRRRRRRRGFTLFEMLIVIALIGLFTAIFVVNFDVMLRQSESDAVQSAFWQAAREARTRSLVQRKPESLRYDAKASAFVVEEAGGANAKNFKIDREKWAPDLKLEVALKKRLPPSQFSLVGGQVVDLREIPAAMFFPDGTCTPFVLTTQVGAKEDTIEIDPWTGAALLASDEK